MNKVNRNLHDLLSLPDNLPGDCLNILLVIARPYGEQDVSYHALARPLVDMLEQQNQPIRVHVLRPPTFRQLRDQLQQRRFVDFMGRYTDPLAPS